MGWREAEDANQVAAPNESRTPNWHRAKIAQLRVRMEGWRQRRLGCAEKVCGTKKIVEKSKKTIDRGRPSHGRDLQRASFFHGIAWRDGLAFSVLSQTRAIPALNAKPFLNVGEMTNFPCWSMYPNFPFFVLVHSPSAERPGTTWDLSRRRKFWPNWSFARKSIILTAGSRLYSVRAISE